MTGLIFKAMQKYNKKRGKHRFSPNDWIMNKLCGAIDSHKVPYTKYLSPKGKPVFSADINNLFCWPYAPVSISIHYCDSILFLRQRRQH
jgi:hypothetical protein